jgi:phosphatidylethanolamine-binding protein (PEBP) family uncharacterized protein
MQDMYTNVLVKAYKAKCLKHLTAARIAIESETSELVKQLAKCSLARDKVKYTPSPSVQSPNDINQNDYAGVTPPPPSTPHGGKK